MIKATMEATAIAMYLVTSLSFMLRRLWINALTDFISSSPEFRCHETSCFPPTAFTILNSLPVSVVYVSFADRAARQINNRGNRGGSGWSARIVLRQKYYKRKGGGQANAKRQGNIIE